MLRSLVTTLALFVITAGLLPAETRTLTDQFGRTITADVIALEGNTLKIRRDDGIVFDLPIANLSIEDQKAIREWAAKQPKPVEAVFEPTPELMPVAISRFKASSRNLLKWEGYSHTHEMWGYSIQLTNKHLRTIDNLRIEYNLFSQTYADLGTPQTIAGSKKIDPMRVNDSINVKTQTTEVCKRRDMYYGNSGGEMRGVWVKVYSGDKLLHDFSSPEGLKDNERWTKPD